MRSGLELDPDDKEEKAREKELADCRFPQDCYCSISGELFVDPVIGVCQRSCRLNKLSYH
jgi:hypothetical protein